MFLKYWAPALLYAGFIVWLSSHSFPERHFPVSFVLFNDKVVHIFEYAILGILCFRVFRFGTGPSTSRFAVCLAILTAVAFGLTDEIHQSFVPNRAADTLDFLADCLGATLGSMGWEWIHNASHTWDQHEET